MLANQYVLTVFGKEVELMGELIKIENITKKFGDNVVLNGLSLAVREGEVVVIVGPSGCGKSTLLRCINGLEPIQDGEITFRGKKVDGNARSIVGIRQKVGMVFQNYELFPHMTILENIILSPPFSSFCLTSS